MCPSDGARAEREDLAAFAGEPPPGYQAPRLLGVGGFATTWQVEDLATGVLALKWGRRDTAAAAQRFAREATLLRLAGPELGPALIEEKQLSGRPCLLMEFIPGPSLRSFLETSQHPVPVVEAAQMASVLAETLAALHAKGIVHRDIKPDNLFLDRNHCRLIDFGLAECIAPAAVAGDDSRAAGSPEYSAPEQWRGALASPSADVYSVGVLLYELVTLRLPFTGDGSSISYQHATLRPPCPSQFAAMPKEFADLILQCLHKDPRARPEAHALVEALPRSAAGFTSSHPARVKLTHLVVPALLFAGELRIEALQLRELVLANRAQLVSHRGESVVLAWAADESEETSLHAQRCAEALVALGASRAYLHLDRALALRGRGNPTLFGSQLEDPATWRPQGTWHDLRRSDALGPPPAASIPLALFMGRDAELSSLLTAYRDMRATRRPVLVTLRGGAGSGKSRLLELLAERLAAEDAGLHVLRLQAGLESEWEDGESIVDAALYGPVLVLCDDLHRLSSQGLDAIEYAALPSRDCPLLIVASARPEFAAQRPRWGQRASDSRELVLAPLPLSQSKALMAQLLLPVEYIADAALEGLVRRCGGVPRALIALANALFRDGAIASDAHGVARLDLSRLDQSSDASSSVDEWLLATHLRRLPEAVAALASVLALVGEPCSSEQLAALSDGLRFREDLADAGTGLFVLREQGLLSLRGDHYVFVQPSWQALLATRLAPEQCQEVHERALILFQRELDVHGRSAQAQRGIAVHARALGDHLLAAQSEIALGKSERDCHRVVDANRHYVRALALLGPAGKVEPSLAARICRLEALQGAGWAQYRMDLANQAASLLDEAATLAASLEDPVSEALALLECATALDWAQRLQDSAARVEAAARITQTKNNAKVSLRLALGLGRTAWRAGQVDEARAFLEDAAEGAAAAGDFDARVVALLLLGPALVVKGKLAAAQARFEELFALCRPANDRLHLCAAYGNRMFLWSARKDPERARDDLRSAMRLARQIGHPGPERVATYNLAEDLYWSGEDDHEALELALRAQDLAERFIAQPVAEDRLLVARCALANGRHDLAQDALAWVRAKVDSSTLSRPSQLFARMVAARLASPEDGIAAWDTLLEESTTELAGDDLLELHYWAIRSALAASDPAEIQRLLRVSAPLLDEHPIWQARFEEFGSNSQEAE